MDNSLIMKHIFNYAFEIQFIWHKRKVPRLQDKSPLDKKPTENLKNALKPTSEYVVNKKSIN